MTALNLVFIPVAGAALRPVLDQSTRNGLCGLTEVNRDPGHPSFTKSKWLFSSLSFLTHQMRIKLPGSGD